MTEPSFPDTGPQADGTRTRAQWQNAISEDIIIIMGNLAKVGEEGENYALCLAVARKEARRLERDIERYGQEVYGISRADIDSQGPL